MGRGILADVVGVAGLDDVPHEVALVGERDAAEGSHSLFLLHDLNLNISLVHPNHLRLIFEMDIPRPNRLVQRQNSVEEELREEGRGEADFPTAEKRGRQGGRQGNTRSLPPKCYMSSPDVQEESNLEKSAIEELKLLEGSNPTEEHVGSTSKTLEGMGIRRSHSFDREKIELSLSSDYIDLDYDNSSLRRAIEEMAKRLESGAMRERAREK